MKNFKQRGFTLIELLVVVAIIGVLTALLLVNLVGVRERGADASKKSNLNQLKTALRLYYNDFQTYPAASSGIMMGCTDGAQACAQAGGSVLTDGSTTYMQSVPEYTEYVLTNGGDGFTVGVELTNASDPEAASSASRCGIGSPTAGVFYVCAD